MDELDEKIKELDDALEEKEQPEDETLGMFQDVQMKLTMKSMTLLLQKAVEGVITSVLERFGKYFDSRHEQLQEEHKAFMSKVEGMNEEGTKIQNWDDMPRDVVIRNIEALRPKIDVKPADVKFPDEIKTKILNEVATYNLSPASTRFERNPMGQITTITEEYEKFTVIHLFRRDVNGHLTTISTEVTPAS